MYKYLFSILLLLSKYTYGKVQESLIDINISTLATMSGCRLKVTSGKRSKSHNAKVGGTEHSWHLVNRARDVVMVGRCGHTYQTLAVMATKLFNGVISYSTHLHVDTRPEKFHKHKINKKYVDID